MLIGNHNNTYLRVLLYNFVLYCYYPVHHSKWKGYFFLLQPLVCNSYSGNYCDMFSK